MYLLLEAKPRAAVIVYLEKGVEDEFKAYYKYDIRSYSAQGAWFRDFMVLFQNLNVITNNTQNTVGGGGRRREPLAPPFASTPAKSSSS